MKIILVDDNVTFREGLRFFIEQITDYNIIAEASNGREFLELNNISDSDIILIDLSMPGIDGIEAAKQILWRYPNLKLIAITMYQDMAYLTRLVEAGFKGCVFKTCIDSDLIDALKTVITGKFFFPKNLKLK